MADDHVAFPPTVMHVMERFVSALRADSAIPEEVIHGLDKLLRAGTTPRPEDLQATFSSRRRMIRRDTDTKYPH
jgi:hypothetical protein